MKGFSMKMSQLYIIKILILGLVSISQTGNAYYFQANKWSKGSTNIIMLPDRHTIPKGKVKSYLRKVQNQRKNLLNILEEHSSMAIIEDLELVTLELADEMNTFLASPSNYDPNKDLELSLEELLKELQHYESPLTGFTQCCHASDIPVYNVDFRYYTDNSIQGKLKADQAYNMYKKVMAEIESYDDSPKFNAIYKKKLDKIKKQFNSCKKFFQRFIKTKLPLNKAIKTTQYDKTLDPIVTHIRAGLYRYLVSKDEARKLAKRDVKSMSDVDKKRILVRDFLHKLIDLRILHQIYVNRKKYKNVIILAGGAHIRRIEKILPQLGYCSESSTDETNKNTELAVLDINEKLPSLLT